MSGAEDEETQRLKARVGSTVRGKWRLDALIGAGGMAAVYAATHHVGHRVAIKILHPEGAVSREQRARFEQEAIAAARLGHPAAVQVHDIDVTEHGEPFLVMELLDGEGLRERALRLGGVALPELLAHVDTLLEVLKAAHDAGIVHRDIKPDNLFVTRDGRLKVLDFGIARMKQGGAGLKTRTGALLGTTSYMAPEQILGRDVDGRADLYAVGATMFTLLTNRRLHDALTEGELLVKMSTTPAPPLAAVAPGVDPRVARVVDRALAFQVEQRYPDAQTMLADVRAVRRGEEPPFATAAVADGDARTRAHGRSLPDGPPLGAPPSAAPPAGALPPAMAMPAAPPAGALPPAMAVPAAPVAAPAVPPAALPGQPPAVARAAPGPRAPAPPQLAIVVGAAVLLFCVGLGAALLLWRSRDKGAGDAPGSGAPASVSLDDVPRAASSLARPTDPGACPPGVPCTCAPGTPGNVPKRCELTCGDAPGCQPRCSERDLCESRCAGNCRSSCDHGKACDTRCADNCAVDCRHVETCQATCGAGCSYTCENAGKCAAVVGEGSVVKCNEVGLCEVTCTGSCAVSCSATGRGCPITCQGQGPAKRCSDGRRACGDGCSLPG
ncbi:serine/threonine protein kinase [Sorangium sp. So ce854]|uniref:serine/threonine protein kinase n=1 Tax=Sorangium sp. So ce854 TaxID=3133322 RepID=UPI003F5E68A6